MISINLNTFSLRQITELRKVHFTSLVARQKVGYSLLTLSQPHRVD